MAAVRTAGIMLIVSCLTGCAARENMLLAVTDSDAYWDRSGYSIKAPSGNDWYKLPRDEKHPNSIIFAKGEGVISRGPDWLLTGTGVVATSTMLDEAVQDRKDKKLLAALLLNHLNRYVHGRTKITNSSYFATKNGLDCLKYTPGQRTQQGEKGAVREEGGQGYFCLHPHHDSFGVIMESRNFTLAWTAATASDRSAQTYHFFKSLRFNPFSSPVSRTIKTTNYQIGKEPSQVACYQTGMWAALKGENRVVQFDPADGKMIFSIPVGKQPAAVAIAGQEIWVANSGDGTVTRIDGKTKIVRTIPVGGKPVAVSVGLGQVWVADSSGNAVIRINPAQNSVAARIAVGLEPVALSVGKEGVWVANAGDGTVSVIDKAHDWIRESIKVGGRPVHISLANTGAWVADESGRVVVRIDRTSKKELARIEVGGQPGWVKAYDDWDLFVSLSDPAKIVRIDPNLNRVFGPPIPTETAPRSLVDCAGLFWFANSFGTTLTSVNLDPSGQVVGTQSLP